MSSWIEVIASYFPPEVENFWITSDPNDLLLNSELANYLDQSGIDIISFDDSVAFRAEYEKNYRHALSNKDENQQKRLILRTSNTDTSHLPWDYIQEAKVVRISFSTIFPNFNTNIIRYIDSVHFNELLLIHNKYSSRPLGVRETKEIVISRLFKFALDAVDAANEFWSEVIDLHRCEVRMPEFLAEHIDEIVRVDLPRNLSVVRLLTSSDYMVDVIKAAWVRYLQEEFSIVVDGSLLPKIEYMDSVKLPLHCLNVRRKVESLFSSGAISPISVEVTSPEFPDWARFGIVDESKFPANVMLQELESVSSCVPAESSSHSDWVTFGFRFGEVLSHYYMLESESSETFKQKCSELQVAVDKALFKWLSANFVNLVRQSYVTQPVMIHHIPHHMSTQRRKHGKKVALVVMDGMSIDQWVIIRDRLSLERPSMSFSECGCFAWHPTVTSVCRQSIFSGKVPSEFSESIFHSKEDSLWKQFWQEEEELSPKQVLLFKGIKYHDRIKELEKKVSDPQVAVSGIVVNMIDDIVHGEQLRKRGVAKHVCQWYDDSGVMMSLLDVLDCHGYQIYITSDHGNVDAAGIGRPPRSNLHDLKGQRVRVCGSERLAAEAASTIGANLFVTAGLPPDFFPLYTLGREAFVPKGAEVVAHGGISMEELIVPFVKVAMNGEGQ